MLHHRWRQLQAQLEVLSGAGACITLPWMSLVPETPYYKTIIPLHDLYRVFY